MIDENEANFLRSVNESLQFEVGKKMMFNPINLRSQLHEENLRKLKEIGMIN